MARSPRLRWISHFDWLIGWWFVCERDYWIDWSFVWCVYLWLCVMRRCGNNFDMLFQNKCIHRNSKKNLEYDIFIIKWFLKRISCKMTLRRSNQIIFIVGFIKVVVSWFRIYRIQQNKNLKACYSWDGFK